MANSIEMASASILCTGVETSHAHPLSLNVMVIIKVYSVTTLTLLLTLLSCVHVCPGTHSILYWEFLLSILGSEK